MCRRPRVPDAQPLHPGGKPLSAAAPPALTLPLDVSGTPESTPSSGPGPGLCWLGDSDEPWDLVCSPDADALGVTLSMPLPYLRRPSLSPAARQEGQLLSLRAFGEERRVRSQDFDWAPPGGWTVPGSSTAAGASGPAWGFCLTRMGRRLG